MVGRLDLAENVFTGPSQCAYYENMPGGVCILPW